MGSRNFRAPFGIGPLVSDALSESHRTTITTFTHTTFPLPWSQAHRLPQNSHGHPVRAKNRDCMGRPASRLGLWLRQNVPPLFAALGRGWCLAAPARRIARRTQWGRQNRLGAVALIDASFLKAPEGGEDTGPNPTDRSKSGSKHHVMTDAKGVMGSGGRLTLVHEAATLANI